VEVRGMWVNNVKNKYIYMSVYVFMGQNEHNPINNSKLISPIFLSYSIKWTLTWKDLTFQDYKDSYVGAFCINAFFFKIGRFILWLF
jgi:hypothetical protein